MKDMLLPSMSMAVIRQGGRGAGDPPLTIPNREVKPRSADGTGKPGEQGAAPVEGKASEGHLRGLLFFVFFVLFFAFSPFHAAPPAIGEVASLRAEGVGRQPRSGFIKLRVEG